MTTTLISTGWTAQLNNRTQDKTLATDTKNLQANRRIRQSTGFLAKGIIFASVILTASITANAVEPAEPSVSTRSTRPAVAEYSRQSEVVYEAMTSYGHYKVFGAAESESLYAAGEEYDRELWPQILGARVDYVSEFLPVLLLSQPVTSNIYGTPRGHSRETVYGMGVTPIGFRLLWRDGSRWMPYFETKASVLGFTQKALSTSATYENWSFHCTGGMKFKLHGRYDLRLGLISDLHFSNAFVVRSNPALDLMNLDVGIVYHLAGRNRTR